MSYFISFAKNIYEIDFINFKKILDDFQVELNKIIEKLN
jgi:hypothetical protein